MRPVLDRRRRGILSGAALPACLFAFVVGARWAVLDRFGTDLPVWDQWDAEGLHLLSPWYAGHFTLAELFLPHNEHRVVLTKLLNLGLTLANGQWDQRLETAVNAFLPALIAVALFLFGRRLLGGRWQAPLFLLVATAFGLPLAWQNIVGGFHSQQIFLIGLSLGAIGWLTTALPWSGRWWLGAICLALAPFSMASGFFAAAVVIALLAVRALRGEISLRAAAPALVLGAGLIVLACLTRVTVSGHEPLKAKTWHDFALTALYALQWPSFSLGWTWLALVLWLPWCWLVGWILRALLLRQGIGGEAGGASAYVLAGLGGWVILQILATGYARGAGAPTPTSRYIDTLAFGAVVNALAWCWLWRSGGGRLPLAVLGLAWMGVFGTGAWLQLQEIFTVELPPEVAENFYERLNMRNYLATGDEAYLQHSEIPYPDPVSLLVRLSFPGLRAALPASVRPPIPLKAAGPPGAFIPFDSRAPQGHTAPPPPADGLSPATPPLSNRVTWGSYGAAGPAEWSSQRLAAPRTGWLKFEVAGHAGQPGAELELRDAGSQKPLAQVRPDRAPGDSWRSAYVRAPARDFVVVAREGDPRRWLAFSEPVEMGTLSYWAWRATKNGLLLAELAGGGALLLGLAACWPRRRSPIGSGRP